MNTHPHTCRCPLHGELQTKRDACYRQLAMTVLGPGAPRGTAALARALADHARKLAPAGAA